MKQKYSILILFLSLMALCAQSQESKKFYLGMEAGSNFVTGEMNNKWFVRQDLGYSYYENDYGNNYGNKSLYPYLDIAYVGIKPEFTFAHNSIGLITGLRYTRINGCLEKFSNTDGSYFYLRNNQTGTNTEYFKVKNINEQSDYLGVPFELRYSPFQKNIYLKYLYIKVGAEVNFKLNSKTDIQFANETMEAFQKDIFDNVDYSTNSIYSSVYTAIGLKLGKPNHINYNFEVMLPSCILTSNNSSLVVPASYSGFQFSILVPIK